MSSQTASTPKKPTILEEVRSRNKSVHPIIVGYLGTVYTSIVLGNHPVSVKLERIFLLRVFVKVLQNRRVCKQKISKVGFVRLAVIRLEALGLDFPLLKP